MSVTLSQRRLAIFRAHRRGYWSLIIFIVIFLVCIFAEFIANDRPLLVDFEGHLFVPVLHDYSEDAFGDDLLPLQADFTDPALQQRIEAHGWMIWPPIRFSYDSVVKDLDQSAIEPLHRAGRDADDGRHQGQREPEQHGEPNPVDDPRQHVACLVVGPQEVAP